MFIVEILKINSYHLASVNKNMINLHSLLPAICMYGHIFECKVFFTYLHFFIFRIFQLNIAYIMIIL